MGRVVVIDDEPMMRRVLSRELEGLDLRLCTSTAEGRAAISPEVCAVVSDYNLGPGEDGLTFLVELRRARPDVLLILVSGAPTARCEAALAAGEIDHLFLKPWPPDGIRTLVAAVAVAVKGSAAPVPTSAKR